MAFLPKVILTVLPASDEIRAAQQDSALVRAAMRSPDAFAALYQQHVEAVYRYLRVRISSEQDAQDLTTKSFIAAMDSLKSYRGEGRIAAWLIGIARRQVALYYRQQKSVVSLDAAETLPHPAALPDELVAQSDQLNRVIAAIHTLPPDRAEAVALRFFAGLSISEIAQVMGKSEPAIRMLVHRAITDLRTTFVEEE